MRVSCPAGSTAPFAKPTTLSVPNGINKFPNAGLSSSFQLCQQQTNRLSGLYQLSKSRNQRLLQISLNLSRDINFLKEYCRCLQFELERVGFYGQKKFERLSRRETAASIFQNYSDTSSLLQEWRSEEGAEEELNRLRCRNFSLENQNKELHSRVGTEGYLRLHRAVQVDTTDLERLRREYQMAQERIGKLTSEISQLRHVNGVLQLQQRRRGVQASILQASKQVFGKIHQIMRDYRLKMSALAHEKQDIQKRYRALKDNIRATETGSQLKLIDLLTQKVDILSKLVEKQQLELENTITVYQNQLSKIEERRREEITFFQNERLGLENENLKLVIDIQKALNRQESTNLLLVQQRNTTQRLAKENVKLSKNRTQLQFKGRLSKIARLRLASGVVKFYGINLKANYHNEEVKPSYYSDHLRNSNDENSNLSNVEYQFSQMSQRGFFKRRLPPETPKGLEGAQSMHQGLQNIKITYNSYLGPVGGSKYPSVDRVYDSAVKYKRRFVESKPDSSGSKR